MKRLKKILWQAFLIGILLLPLQSCLDDGYDKNAALLTIGTIHVIEGNDYYFELDEGTKMYPGDTTQLHNYHVVNGQRAFIYFTLLDEKINGYDYNANISHIENILTKDIYYMPQEEEDSIGDDKINITEMWFTNNYLNIQYQFYYSDNPEKKHMLNLIVNRNSNGETTEEENDYITLEFRHNAYEDKQSKRGDGLVSFKLNEIEDMIKGKKGLNIRVKTLYDGIQYKKINFIAP
ncbi:NigD-like protein [uncultured Bacteroides sp.]|uniref:NigD-like protein n=1 Tax=uncultured Bacteroides sp. TaxID=162156 RepID=UPI0026118033|nr:NigD-like protein [uncultured Bacteroides sp.]